MKLKQTPSRGLVGVRPCAPAQQSKYKAYIPAIRFFFPIPSLQRRQPRGNSRRSNFVRGRRRIQRTGSRGATPAVTRVPCMPTAPYLTQIIIKWDSRKAPLFSANQHGYTNKRICEHHTHDFSQSKQLQFLLSKMQSDLSRSGNGVRALAMWRAAKMVWKGPPVPGSGRHRTAARPKALKSTRTCGPL